MTYIDKSKEFIDKKSKDYLDKLEETLDREKLQSYMHVVLSKGVFPGAEHYPDGTVRVREMLVCFPFLFFFFNFSTK